MRTQTVAAIVLIGLLGLVNTQPPAGLPPGIPTDVLEKITKFHSDITSMKAAGKVDDTVVIADVQAIADAAQANLKTAPQQIQDQVTKIQAQITAIKASGKADPATISNIIASFIGLASSASIPSFPGQPMNGGQNDFPGMNAGGGLPGMDAGGLPGLNGGASIPSLKAGQKKTTRKTTSKP